MDRIDQLLARNRRNGRLAPPSTSTSMSSRTSTTPSDMKRGTASGGGGGRMSNTLRDADTIGRMGGDEFVVLIDGSDPMVAPELVAERLLDVMQEPFELDAAADVAPCQHQYRHRRRRSCQRGASCCAMRILRSTRPRPKERTAISSSARRCSRKIGRRIALEFDLRSALAGDQFRLVYQPIYNLDDLSVVGVEALLRWVHPARGHSRSGRVHPDPRTDRADPRDRAYGCCEKPASRWRSGTPGATRSTSR